jgi:hypothetical protein
VRLPIEIINHAHKPNNFVVDRHVEEIAELLDVSRIKTNLSYSLRELVSLLKDVAPDGQMLMKNLAHHLSKWAAAGKTLPPQLMQLVQNDSKYFSNNGDQNSGLCAK